VRANLQAYVIESLGPRYVEPQPLQLSAVFTDSSANLPLIFVLSQGSDPMADLLKFAEEKHRQVAIVLSCSAMTAGVRYQIMIL
jgi:dynein heavy chain, axonemal